MTARMTVRMTAMMPEFHVLLSYLCMFLVALDEHDTRDSASRF